MLITVVLARDCFSRAHTAKKEKSRQNTDNCTSWVFCARHRRISQFTFTWVRGQETISKTRNKICILWQNAWTVIGPIQTQSTFLILLQNPNYKSKANPQTNCKTSKIYMQTSKSSASLRLQLAEIILLIDYVPESEMRSVLTQA